MTKQQFVYVAYRGSSTLSLPAPGHGHSYVFLPMPVRNKVEASVWEELSSEQGSATIYLQKRVMRKTSAGDGFDRVESVRKIPIAKGQLPQVTAVSADNAGKDAVLAQLQATVVRQSALIEEMRKQLEARPSESAADDPEPSDAPEELDPSNFSAKSIKRAIKDLTLEQLEGVKDREIAGKNRDAVLRVLDAALDEALMREEQG